MPKMLLAAVSIGMILALGNRAVVASDKPIRFVQDRFVVGFWVDPPADENMDRYYAEIADDNFTLVVGGFGAQTPETIQRQIALCEKYGLKALVASMKTPPGYPNVLVIGRARLPVSPAVWGYFIYDEPNVGMYHKLRKIVDGVRKDRPGSLAFINLFPNVASESQLGTKSYEEYVKRFVDEVNVDVLCMDHYPMMTPEVDGRINYCSNLEVMRKYALRQGIPFWNFFNVMPFGPQYDPTEAQLKWQIYTSLAYGAKGVLYFCYWTPVTQGDDSEFTKGGAIITAEGRKTRHYEQAKRINRVVKNWGPTLMKLTSAGVYRVEPKDDPGKILAGTPFTGLTKGDYLIGVFRHTDGRRAVLLNNYSFAYTAWPTVAFDVPIEQVREVSGETGEEIPIVDDSPIIKGCQISLDSGEGRLFLLPRKPR